MQEAGPVTPSFKPGIVNYGPAQQPCDGESDGPHGLETLPTSREKARVVGRFTRVLIVEDDERQRDALVVLIRDWKAEVLVSETAKTGIKLLSSAPDLVILDIRLPDDNGIVVAEAASRLNPAPMIVAISGLASAVEAFQLSQLGVEVYLQKPFSLEEFTAKVQIALVAAESPVRRLSAACPVSFSDKYKQIIAESLEAFAIEHQLTPRQKEMVRMAVRGIPRKRFPEVLGISENTCKTIIRRLLHKCGARHLSDIPRMLVVR